MNWVTHVDAGLDGLASAWLVLRQVDAEARFVFVPTQHVHHVATVLGGYAYDVPGGDFAHRKNADGEKCTFQVLVEGQGLAGDPALARLAEAVGRVDVGGGPGDDELAVRLAEYAERSRAAGDDHGRLAQLLPVLDTLYPALTALYASVDALLPGASRAADAR